MPSTESMVFLAEKGRPRLGPREELIYAPGEEES